MQVGSNDDNQVTKEIERVTTNVITEVNLAGFTREKSELIPQGKGYRTYVLLRYPLGDSNRMIVDQMKKSAVLDAKLRASEAFKELEKEIESAKPARWLGVNNLAGDCPLLNKLLIANREYGGGELSVMGL